MQSAAIFILIYPKQGCREVDLFIAPRKQMQLQTILYIFHLEADAVKLFMRPRQFVRVVNKCRERADGYVVVIIIYIFIKRGCVVLGFIKR